VKAGYVGQTGLRAREEDPIMSDTDGVDVEDLIGAAQTYAAGDPDQEIAVLQDLLRAAWGLMTERQQSDLADSDEAQTVLQPDDEDEEEEPDAE
jgi:hypothetical protein